MGIMKPGNHFCLGLGATVALASQGTAAWAGPSVPRGAYITRPVVSGQDLAKLVRASPVVRQRYEKAWGLSTVETLKRFAGIRLGKMPQTAMLNVYYFRPATGNWGYKLRRVKQGTPVFLRTDGTPVMMKICGNPIAKPAKPVSPQDQAKVPDFTPEESIEVLHTDTPPPADPAPFPPDQRSVALQESGAPLPAEPASPPETIFLTETPEIATDSGAAPKQEKKRGGGIELPFNLILSSLGSSVASGFLDGGGPGGMGMASTSNLGGLASFALPSGTTEGLPQGVVRTPTLAPRVTRTEEVGDVLGNTGGGGGKSVRDGGDGSLSAPEPSLALMLPLLPIVLGKTRLRPTR